MFTTTNIQPSHQIYNAICIGNELARKVPKVSKDFIHSLLLLVKIIVSAGGTNMSSIALFPCLPTLESGIIGELSSTLTLKVYTDENLLRETASQFGGNPERL